MTDRTEKECDLIVAGIKKVCKEKHIGVEREMENLKDTSNSINNKLNGLYVLLIIQILALGWKIIAG